MWNVKYVVKTPGDMDDMNSTFDFKEEAIEYAQKWAKPGEEVSVEAVEIETDRYGSVVNAGERYTVWSNDSDFGEEEPEVSYERLADHDYLRDDVKFSDEDLITEAFATAEFKAACPALADCRDATVAKVVGAYAKDMGINKAEADVAEFKEWFETTSVANFIVDYLEEIGSLQAVADLGIHDEGFMKACKAMAKDMGIIDEEGHDVLGNDGTVMKDLDLIFWAIDSEIDPVNGVKALKKYITEGCEMEESINKAEINKEVDKKHCADNDTENMTLNEAAEDLDDITEDIYIKAIISDDDCEGGECSRDYERAFFDSDFNEFQTEFGDIEGCDKVCDTMPDFSDHVEIETERPDICDDVVTCDVWPEVDSKDTIHGGYVGEKPAEVDAEHKVERPFDVEDDEFPEVEDEVKEFKPKAPYAFEDEFGEEEDEKEEEDDKDSDDDSDDEGEKKDDKKKDKEDKDEEDDKKSDESEDKEDKEDDKEKTNESLESDDEWPEPAEYEAKEARAYHAGDFDYSDIEDVDESVNRSEANAPVEKKHCADNDSKNLTLNESDDEELGEEFCNELYDKLHEKRDGVEEGVCKRHKIITHSEDEEPVDCFGEKKPLDKPLTEDADVRVVKIDKTFDECSDDLERIVSQNGGDAYSIRLEFADGAYSEDGVVLRDTAEGRECLSCLDSCADNVYIPDGVTVIKSCSLAPMEVWLPKSVKKIESGAFAFTDVRHIGLNDGLEEIESEAFRNCNDLMSITIPASVKKIGDDLFFECDGGYDPYYDDDEEDEEEGIFVHFKGTEEQAKALGLTDQINECDNIYLKCDNDAVTESLKEDLSKDLNDWQKYVEHLQSEIEKAEAALKGEKNEMIKASTQKKIDAMKAELEEAMPNILKDAAIEEVDPEAATDLPAPAEAELDATDNVAAEEPAEAPVEEPVEESLTEDVDEDVGYLVIDLLSDLDIDYSGDVDSGIIVTEDELAKIAPELHDAGIGFETQHFDLLSREEIAELPSHLRGFVNGGYVEIYDFSKDDLDDSITDPDLAE